MGELAVRQPHLGRDAILLLGRIVDSQADGVAMDDMEPYLLVRLRRCGYVRPTETDAWVFAATPAGAARWRFESLAAARRQADVERREIVRRQIQVMRSRLGFDDAGPQPTPPVGDVGPPPRLESEPPRAWPPQAPAIRAARVARVAREDDLGVIRAAGLRAGRDLPERPVTDLPALRVAGLPARREHAPPVAHDDDLPAILLSDLFGAHEDPPEADDDEPPPEPKQAGGGGWRRGLTMTFVATAVLLGSNPTYRYLVSSNEAPPEQLIAQPPAQAATAPRTAEATGAAAVVAPSGAAAAGYAVADQVPPRVSELQPEPVVSAVVPAIADVTPAQEPVVLAGASELPPVAAVHEPATAMQTAALEAILLPAVDPPAPENPPVIAEATTTPRADVPPAVVMPAAAVAPAEATPPPAEATPPAVEPQPVAVEPTPVVAAPVAVVAPSAPAPTKPALDHQASTDAVRAAAPARQPIVKRPVGIAAQQEATTRMVSRPRIDQTDDSVVDRLNRLSLQAAQQGRAFSPRAEVAKSLTPSM